jgi:tripartite-type tricarboxylate transporter receptor subunit TctC
MLARSGVEPVMSSSEEFGGFLRAEIAKWTKVVRESDIRIE